MEAALTQESDTVVEDGMQEVEDERDGVDHGRFGDAAHGLEQVEYLQFDRLLVHVSAHVRLTRDALEALLQTFQHLGTTERERLVQT